MHCRDVIWRYSRNPIIPRDLLLSSNSIFNSAVVPFDDGFAGVFRCDNKKREMNIHRGFSRDGITWQIDEEPIEWITADPGLNHFEYRYDPRVVWLEDRYYITWCNGYHGPTIGIGYTYDFQVFHFLENGLLPFNRNGVLFPRRINDRYLMLNRPSDNGHTPFGDIFLSQSLDMIHWGEHRFVMGTKNGWQNTKIGAGPVPIETPEGWLLFYHGVLTSCNGFVYSFGAALLDLDQPWRVVRRGSPYLLSPQKDYECVGDVPNVTFPCAALYDQPTGRIAIYYGGADTVTALAFTTLDDIRTFLHEHSDG
ncbi:MAG: glycoside hydrolase family 130 protein [Anaerolineaceae bacterium]|nr:glycoside hydrolase family 130 protein [Anaerolineaceae bacterium]MBN2677017.1 glycoside hydrolase family 130 protein [Anaerolineaceae bacterium]